LNPNRKLTPLGRFCDVLETLCDSFCLTNIIFSERPHVLTTKSICPDELLQHIFTTHASISLRLPLNSTGSFQQMTGQRPAAAIDSPLVGKKVNVYAPMHYALALNPRLLFVFSPNTSGLKVWSIHLT
jgi:hypothetical protein